MPLFLSLLTCQQTHMVNDTLYAVIKRAGRIPQIEPRPQPKEEPYQPPPTPTRETLTPSDEQQVTATFKS